MLSLGPLGDPHWESYVRSSLWEAWLWLLRLFHTGRGVLLPVVRDTCRTDLNSLDNQQSW